MKQILEVHFTVVNALRSKVDIMVKIIIGNMTNSGQLLIGNIFQAVRKALLLAHTLMGDCVLNQVLEQIFSRFVLPSDRYKANFRVYIHVL